jgi:hypothetical protein
MGYMGFGMQSWISRMKPRKFLDRKRLKPDGGGGEKRIVSRDIEDYYTLKKNSLKNLLKKEYKGAYKNRLRLQLSKERHRQNMYLWLSFFIALIITISLLYYLSTLFDWF